MLVSRFYAYVLKDVRHNWWHLTMSSKEATRGIVRGAAHRERLLHPSAAKSMQRLRRKRLVAAYIRRFGEDSFGSSLSVDRFAKRHPSFWLHGGYAWWRERLLGRHPMRPF
jgi:hypothetical protein